MAQKDYSMVTTNRLEMLESPIALLPGMEPIFTVHIAGTGTIASPTMKLYKGSKDVSTTNLSGVMAVSGRAITTKKLTTLTPGKWAMYIYYTDGGIAEERFCKIFVSKEQA